MTVLFDHEKAVLKFNKETNSVELIWKQMQDESTYKLMFTNGLEAIKETGATGWMSDIRKEGVVGPALSNWMQKEILPKAISYGLKRIAVVMDSDVFKQFYVNNIRKTTGNEIMKYFGSEHEARKWLTEAVAIDQE